MILPVLGGISGSYRTMWNISDLFNREAHEELVTFFYLRALRVLRGNIFTMRNLVELKRFRLLLARQQILHRLARGFVFV